MFTQGSCNKDEAGLGFHTVSVSYLKGNSLCHQPDSLFPRTQTQDPGIPSSLNAFPSQVCGPTLRLGSGKHRKREGSKRDDRESARVGRGPSVPPACARVYSTQVRG